MPGNVGVPGGTVPPPSQPGSGVFNTQQAAATAIATSADGTPTYDALGLPSNLGKQRIYVGYLGPRADPNDNMPGADRNKTAFSDTTNQTVSVDDLLNHFADLAKAPNAYSRQLWAQTQMQMQAIPGVYGQGSKINFGAWGPDDAIALKKLANAYLQGTDAGKLETFEEYVKDAAAQGAANGLDKDPNATNPKRAPLSLTNTADLNQAGDNVSQQFLGHAQSAGQQTDFANCAAYEQPATAADAARQYVLQNNMPEYVQHQAEGFMNVFTNMFLPSNSSRANTSLGDAAVGVK
jgi:hypothetical protein